MGAAALFRGLPHSLDCGYIDKPPSLCDYDVVRFLSRLRLDKHHFGPLWRDEFNQVLTKRPIIVRSM